MSRETPTRIVIVGGGFGGVKLALSLSGSKEFAVTLVSQSPEFRYYPALFRTATGGSRKASAIPLADIFAGKQITLEYKKVEVLNRQAKAIRIEGGRELTYDVLVLALGSVTSYLGIKGLSEYSYGIKSLEEAEELKLHLHQHLIDHKSPDLNYVVIGGGSTGVELAGELPGYMKRVMQRHGLEQRSVQVSLIEAAPRLMPHMPEDVSHAMERRLIQLGVTLHLGEAIQAETADAVMINGEALKSKTVIWTAGMDNNPFFAANGFKLSPKGKVLVDEFLQAEPDIYVMGDAADTMYSGMAQTALYDADFVACNLKSKANGQATKAYRPKKPIYVMPAGPQWAAVLWGNLRIYGWLGWVLRRLADLVAYHDIAPWWEASKLWMAESDTEEGCPNCK
jgi:NADH dehydrogenase